MKITRTDQTIIKLDVQMTPDEAEALRTAIIKCLDMVTNPRDADKHSFTNEHLTGLTMIRDGIGRVF